MIKRRRSAPATQAEPRRSKRRGQLVSSTADELRAKAEECREEAEKAISPRDKAVWLRIAKSWLKLAQRTDKRKPPKRKQ